jgi:hypothetical protein
MLATKGSCGGGDHGPDVFDVDLRRWLQHSVARPRATKKRDLAELAVKHLWPNGVPTELTNKQIVKQAGDWLTDYCKREALPKPDISSDTLLRRSQGMNGIALDASCGHIPGPGADDYRAPR